MAFWKATAVIGVGMLRITAGPVGLTPSRLEAGHRPERGLAELELVDPVESLRPVGVEGFQGEDEGIRAHLGVAGKGGRSTHPRGRARGRRAEPAARSGRS